MRFYKLTLSTDEKIIGRYPQSTEMVTTGDFGFNKNFNLGYEGPIKKLNILPETKLEDKAVLTDIVDSCYLISPYFLIVNPNLITLFIKFNLPDYEVFDSPVHHKGDINKYQLFHIEYPSNDEVIDFSKSKFYIGERGQAPSNAIRKVDNFKHYKKVQQHVKIEFSGKNLLCKELTLDFSKNSFDLFRLTVVPALGYFISERLKDAIEGKGFTGFDFKEIDSDKCNIKVIY